jgi:hypothetical protein
VQDVLDDAGREIISKYSIISRTLIEALEPFGEAFADEIIDIKSSLDDARRSLQRMYKNNEMYLQDISQTYDASIDRILYVFV